MGEAEELVPQVIDDMCRRTVRHTYLLSPLAIDAEFVVYEWKEAHCISRSGAYNDSVGRAVVKWIAAFQ